MKGKKKICWGILFVFLITTFQSTIAYAKESIYGRGITQEERIITETPKEKDVIILQKLKDVIKELDTKENIDKFIITKDEIIDIKAIIVRYDELLEKIYVSNKYNKTNELFELRQKIVGHINILCNARNTDKNIKEELTKIGEIIINTNILLLDEIILLIDNKIINRPVDINNNLFTEIKDMHNKAQEINNNGGMIQSVDIQKYAYNKGLQILSNINEKFPDENDGEKPEEKPEIDKIKDTDDDGLEDFIEEIFNGNKEKEDTDGDGLSDKEEYKLHPYCKLDNSDTDGNGVSDFDEDLDGDGLTNGEEFKYKTHPLINDTDGDGINDYDEIMVYKTDPNKKDTDDDELIDSEEIELGTNPLEKDTDKNGINDKDEKFTKIFENKEINIEAKGNKDAIKSLSIDEANDELKGEIPGQVSSIYDINYDGEIEELEITFDINTKSKNFKDINDLKVMYFDEEDKVLKLVNENQKYNQKSNQITVNAKKGRRFILVSYSIWLNNWLSYLPALGKPDVDGNLKRDFLILMDNSAIMRYGFDKANERIGATEWFTDKLFKDDRVAFAKYNKTIQEESIVNLTYNKEEVNKSLREEIDDDNFLDSIKDIWGKAINIIKPEDEKEKDREKYIIFLTTSYPNDEYEIAINLARFEKVRVIVFDCHKTFTDHDYLKKLAYQTGGTYFDPYFHSANLWGTYKLALDFAGGWNNADNSGVDSDEDGLSDELEKNGIRDGYGILYKTDPNKKDTDGDGIDDGAEACLVEHIEQKFEMQDKPELGMDEYNGGKYFKFLSDPGKSDTDGDDVDDLYEVELGISDPFRADKDFDGLNDLEELEIGTDPNNKDTDGDNYNDKQESLVEHFNPLVYDDPISVFEYTDQFIDGLLKGDAIENPTVINLAGAIAGNLIPGIGTLADIRDMIINSVKGDYVTAGLNLAGIIPASGDSAQVMIKITNFFENFKYTDRLTEALPIVLKWGDELLPGVAKLDLIKKMLISNGAVDFIGDFFGISSDENGRAISKEEISKQVSEILLKIYNKVDIDINEFVKAIEELGKLDDTFIKKDFKRFGELIKDVALDENGKYSAELAKKFLEDTSIHLDIIKGNSTIKQKRAMINRLKGFMGEFLDSNKATMDGYENILREGKKVVNHGPDVVGWRKIGDKYEMRIIESKAFKQNLREQNLSKYFKYDKKSKTYFFDLDYILNYVQNKNEIIEKIKSGKLEIKFDLSILQGDEAKNLGITKNFKDNIFKSAGKDDYTNIAAKYSDKNNLNYMQISIKWGTQKLNDVL